MIHLRHTIFMFFGTSSGPVYCWSPPSRPACFYGWLPSGTVVYYQSIQLYSHLIVNYGHKHQLQTIRITISQNHSKPYLSTIN